MAMAEESLNELEELAGRVGVRVALLHAYQMGQLVAYTECLEDVGMLPKVADGPVARFLDEAPAVVERVRMGEWDA